MPMTNINGKISVSGPATSDAPLYVHPAFVAVNHKTEFIKPVHVDQSSLCNPRLFEVKDGVARHIGKLLPLTHSEIQKLSQYFFSSTDIRFLIFEDIVLEGECDDPATYKRQRFRYQANWHRTLNTGDQYLSNQQRRSLGRKMRKLEESLGSEPEHVFRPASSDDIDLVAEMNRKTVESRGGGYKLTDQKKDRLKAICEQLGFSSMLVHKGRVIAGDIICMTGHHAYFPLVGYDAEFSKYSPGLFLHTKSLDVCVARGCIEAHFLWGDSRWKSDLGAQRQPLDTIVVSKSHWDWIRPTGIELFAPHAVKSIKRWLSRALKQSSFG